MARSTRRLSLLPSSLKGLLPIFGLLAIGALNPTAAEAQGTAIKPNFMVVVDTSGSMRSTDTGSGNNTCGQPRSRMSDAKCAIQRTVNAFGDVNFGLASFDQRPSGSVGANCHTDCCNAAYTCNSTLNSGTIRVPIGEENQAEIIRWVDHTTNACSSTASNPELHADGFTPLGGALARVRNYYQTSGIIASDPARSCRPSFVILLTDGAELCSGGTPSPNAVTRAGQLRSTPIGGTNYDIRTYVIHFGPSNANGSNAIAAAGGTNANAPGNAYRATNEETLAVAFAQIIQDAVLIEECNGMDDDCDNRVDEGFPLFCDRPNGVNTARLCTDPGERVCDNRDDNCNGETDEGLRNLCNTCGPAPAEICDRIDNNCNGAIDEGDVCAGCVPSAEICDNVDNDCDGRIDESLTRGCGTDVGDCMAGTEECIAGNWRNCTATNGGPEVCDGRDNDCNGVIDGLSRDCGSSVGICRPGQEICLMGGWSSCNGEVTPGSETCNGLDDDCDGSVDEMVMGSGDACGETEGECEAGTLSCVAGALVCVGAIGPMDEICDGLDNDCDGLADDGLGVGAPCGSDIGECSPGFNVCRDGAVQCDGQIGPTDETCDSLDNDCDSRIDESVEEGAACGSDVGACMQGTEQCIEGRDTCVGSVPPSMEICDCIDNDCDGEIDEEAGGEGLCPGGSSCVDCQCALPCQATEFGISCPTGKAPNTTGADDCFCVAELCNAETCGQETITRDGTTLCAPDGFAGGCVCKANECTFSCEGVICADGTVCNPRDPLGRCVADTCVQLGCATGEVCNSVSGACESDACSVITCAPTQACREGACEDSCATTTCPDGQLCRRGACVADLCVNPECIAGDFCDPADGMCKPNRCMNADCGVGSVCSQDTGTCITDPCLTLRCPEGEFCVDGECSDTAETPDGGTDAGTDGGTDAGDAGNGGANGRQQQVLATGGGGIGACSAASGSGNGGLGALSVFGLIGLIAFARRRRRLPFERIARGAASTAAVSLLLFVGGCEVDPFCINCTEEPAPVEDVGPPDVTMDVMEDTGPPDVAMDVVEEDTEPPLPDGCTPGADELCNNADDDCDGAIDEGVDTSSDVDNCGACGRACAPPQAFGECSAGNCSLMACDVGWFNIDGDDSNGCEYRCLPSAEDDVLCDRRDNNCNGTVDEGVAFDTDPLNCGSCARTCRFAHAAAGCGGGECQLGACDENFHDVDGNPANGCEYACIPTDPPTEICDNRDNDCNGMVDEGDPGGGAACGSDVGACVAGVERCVGGSVICEGEMGPGGETCDGIDNDCDGSADEGFLSGDVTNCGACGNVCSFPNAVPVCESRMCVLASCMAGFWNVDGNDANGCEYMCDFAGTEVCNGQDDDCDGNLDEGVSAPATLCNANGVCAGTSPTCAGGAGWECNYPATYEDTETRCDALDNDCDGMVDEPFTTLGNACSNGTGSCQRTGQLVCRGDMAGVTCNAPPAGMPGVEVCDNADNDCDGRVDEPRSNPGSNPSYVVDDMVRVSSNLYMYRYEASRPDASNTAQGLSPARSCSNANVLPWTNVTYPEARDACMAAGLRLCTEAEFERACMAGGGCAYSYANACTTYNGNRCNGNDYDPDPAAGDQDRAVPTGARAQCYANLGGSNRIHDLSGNVKEWMQRRSANINPLRGGSYNNPQGGLRCDFDFTVANDVFQFENVGFRCCSTSAP